jgi:glutamyl-tRNA synthetase
LVLRVEDLDRSRSKPEFAASMFEDLRWFGFRWQEGPDCGGPFSPYRQSERQILYWTALQELCLKGFVYPCSCSRQDVLRASNAPHAGEDEPVYPGTCRPSFNPYSDHGNQRAPFLAVRTGVNYRFRIPDEETISFVDGHFGLQRFVAGKDFGDFLVWRHDDTPSYQLAVVVDDAGMRITEVVRGADLLKSTARQLLLYRALDLAPPEFFHCPLVLDSDGQRLAKRHDSLSLKRLRSDGVSPEEIRQGWAESKVL